MIEEQQQTNLSAYATFRRALSRIQQADRVIVQQGDLTARADVAPETRARRDIIDAVLEAFGWDLRSFSRTMVEEARLRRKARARYADYLGIAFPELRPLLVIEAKEIDAAAPSPQRDWLKTNSDWADAIPELIQAALAYNEDGEGSAPLSSVWLDWLSDLRDYESRCVTQHGTAPKVVVLTSGNWWLVITDVGGLIAGEQIDGEDIRFFPALTTIESPTFFDTLARSRLYAAPDHTIEPGELLQYCRAEDIRWVGNAIWTTQSNDTLPRYSVPRLMAGAAVTIVLTDGTVLRIASAEASIVPANSEFVAGHLKEVRELRRRLIEDIKTVAPSFPTQGALRDLDQQHTSNPLFITWPWPSRGDVWVLTLGEFDHFLAPDENLFSCPFHSYVAARDDGHGTRTPYLNPTVEPPIYFASGHNLHCASQIVHDRRTSKCKVAPVEATLCCRACSYSSLCWSTDELRQFPCNKQLATL